MTPTRPTVVIADDHPLMRAALSTVLSEAFEVVAAVGDGRELIATALRLMPRVVLVDAVMPVLDGVQATAQLRASLPRTCVLILSGYEEAALRQRALEAGAQGWLSKSASADELLSAVQVVASGGRYIAASAQGVAQPAMPPPPKGPLVVTPRERDVLQMIVRGRTMKEAGLELGITPRTVAFHKYRMMEHLRVSSTAELVKLALQHGVE